MSLNGYNFREKLQNGPKLCVTMCNGLISVKNCKNSQFWAEIGKFGHFNPQKMLFLMSLESGKYQFSTSHPYGLQQKWLQFWHRTIRGLVAMGHLKKKLFLSNFCQVSDFQFAPFSATCRKCIWDKIIFVLDYADGQYWFLITMIVVLWGSGHDMPA